MRRILAILLVTMLFAGCCVFTGDGKFCSETISNSVCGGTARGYTATVVAYGDSKLIVVPISKIRPNTEWRFVLAPLKLDSDHADVDYNDVNVEIKGKSAEPPLPSDHNAWIDTAGPEDTTISGTYNGAADHTLTACVKGLPDTTPDTTYTYIVEVTGVGTLDPRGDVEM